MREVEAPQERKVGELGLRHHLDHVVSQVQAFQLSKASNRVSGKEGELVVAEIQILEIGEVVESSVIEVVQLVVAQVQGVEVGVIPHVDKELAIVVTQSVPVKSKRFQPEI